MAGGGENVRLPSWVVVLIVGLLTGGIATGAGIVFQAGGVSDNLRHLAEAVDRIDARLQRLEGAAQLQGNRITALEARQWPAATTRATPVAPPTP